MNKVIKLRQEVFYKENKERVAFGKTVYELDSEIEIDGVTHWFEFHIYCGSYKDAENSNFITDIIYHNLLQYNINNPGSFRNDFVSAMEDIYNNISKAFSYPNEYELASIKVDKATGEVVNV